jgi:hypothetical protein
MENVRKGEIYRINRRRKKFGKAMEPEEALRVGD